MSKVMDLNLSENASPSGTQQARASLLENLWLRILYVLISFLVLWLGAVGNADLTKTRLLMAIVVATCLLFGSTLICKLGSPKHILSNVTHVNIFKACTLLLLAFFLSGCLLHFLNRDVLSSNQSPNHGITLLKDLVSSLDLFSWTIILIFLVPVLSFSALAFLLPLFGAFNLSLLGALTLSLAIGNLTTAPVFFMGLYTSSRTAEILNPFLASLLHSAFYFLLLFAIRVFL